MSWKDELRAIGIEVHEDFTFSPLLNSVVTYKFNLPTYTYAYELLDKVSIEADNLMMIREPARNPYRQDAHILDTITYERFIVEVIGDWGVRFYIRQLDGTDRPEGMEGIRRFIAAINR